MVPRHQFKLKCCSSVLTTSKALHEGHTVAMDVTLLLLLVAVLIIEPVFFIQYATFIDCSYLKSSLGVDGYLSKQSCQYSSQAPLC